MEGGTGRGVSPTSRDRVEAHAKVNGNVLVDCGEKAASVDQFLSL